MMLLFLATLLSVFENLANSQTIQLYDPSTLALKDASESCRQAFASNVTCNYNIGRLFANRFTAFESGALDEVCTNSCYQSLTAHRNDIRNACHGAQWYDEFTDTHWLPEYRDEYLLYSYDLACLKTEDGMFCADYMREIFDPALGSTECDHCILASAQRQINSPFAQDDGVRENFASLTSSCSASGYPTTTLPPLLLSSNLPTRTCSGTTYTVGPTDNFDSVPRSQSVATEQLLNSNGLSYNKTDFPPPGSTLCVERQCSTHLLVQGDTCASIAAAAGISTVQFRAWNLNINRFCNNLASFIGNTFCISNPRGDFAIPDRPIQVPVTTAAPAPPEVAPNVTTNCAQYYTIEPEDDCSTVAVKFSISSFDFLFLNPSVNETCKNLWLGSAYCVQAVGDITNYPGYPGGPTSITLPPFTAGPSTSIPWEAPMTSIGPQDIIIPFANSTREDCWQYIWLNQSAPSGSPEASDCWALAEAFGIDRSLFALWNPSIDQNPDDAEEVHYDYDCTLPLSSSFCIALASPTPEATSARKPPSPRATGEIANCIWWFLVTEDDPCDMMLRNLRLSMEDFYRMNPSVNADCSGLSDGTNYCGSTREIGVYAGVFVDDEVGEVTTTPSPTRSQSNASNTASRTVTTTGVVITPTPVQPDMTRDCVSFYKVISGDGCPAIAQAHNIPLQKFYEWNPAVGSDCRTLAADHYVCVRSANYTPTPSPTSVGTPPPGPTQEGIPSSCNRWKMQEDGVYCYDMAAAAGISLERLYALNPALGGDCSGLWAGYAYCVGTA